MEGVHIQRFNAHEDHESVFRKPDLAVAGSALRKTDCCVLEIGCGIRLCATIHCGEMPMPTNTPRSYARSADADKPNYLGPHF